MSTPLKTNPTQNFSTLKPEPSLPNSFSSTHWKVMGAILILLVASLGYKIFSKPSIKLISPSSNQVLGADALDFQWQSNKTKISYVIEVFDQETSELVMRHITDTEGYKPDNYQQSFFQKDHNYYWVISFNQNTQNSYSFSSSPSYFKINNAVDRVVPQATQSPNIQQDQPQPTPNLPKGPIRSTDPD